MIWELFWGSRTWELPREYLLFSPIVSATVWWCLWQQPEAVHTGLWCLVEAVMLLKFPHLPPEQNRLQRANYSSCEELENLFTFPSSGKLSWFGPTHFPKSSILEFVCLGFFPENLFNFQNHLVKKKKKALVLLPENTLVWTFRLYVIICVFLQACCVSRTLRFPCFSKLKITHERSFLYTQ